MDKDMDNPNTAPQMTNVISFKTKQLMSQDTLNKYIDAYVLKAQTTPAVMSPEQQEAMNSRKILYSQILELIMVQNFPYTVEELYQASMNLFVSKEDAQLEQVKAAIGQIVGEALDMAVLTGMVKKTPGPNGEVSYTTQTKMYNLQIHKFK